MTDESSFYRRRLDATGWVVAIIAAGAGTLTAWAVVVFLMDMGWTFLPGVVGLVTSRGSAAERDVVENARRRQRNHHQPKGL